MEKILEDNRSKQHSWPNFNFTSSPWEVRDEVKSQMQTDRYTLNAITSYNTISSCYLINLSLKMSQ